MNEDPTRRMDAPDPGEPDRPGGLGRRSKVLIGVLVAAVIGLGVALAVVASGDGESDDPGTELAPASEETEPTEPAPTEPATTETEPTTTDTGTTTTTDTTDTTTDTDGGGGDGSGGVEAP